MPNDALVAIRSHRHEEGEMNGLIGLTATDCLSLSGDAKKKTRHFGAADAEHCIRPSIRLSRSGACAFGHSCGKSFAKSKARAAQTLLIDQASSRRVETGAGPGLLKCTTKRLNVKLSIVRTYCCHSYSFVTLLHAVTASHLISASVLLGHLSSFPSSLLPSFISAYPGTDASLTPLPPPPLMHSQ